MPMYDLIQQLLFENIRKFDYRDEPNDNIVNSEFKFKIKITGKTPAAGNTKNVKDNVKVAVLLKYSTNFWRTLEMPLLIWKLISL